MMSGTALFKQARDTLIEHRSDYQRAVAIRLEFAELPKTVSGKIRRGELRGIELQRALEMPRPPQFWEDDFVELKRE
jgi:acyl-coenzyme A synthetase/AMP-(fatty) acid ligase